MAVISTLAISIRANADKFIGAMRKVTGVIGRVIGAMKRIAGAIAPVALALVGLSGISLIGTIQQTRKLGDEVGKLSDEIGIGVDQLFALRKAAELTGTTTAILTSGLQRMNRRIGEANAGYGEAVKGLEGLGLAARDLAGMTAFEQFKTIADRVQNLGTQADKAAATYTLFGRQGSKLMNMFALQGQGIDEILKRTQRLQGSFSRMDLRGIEAMNDRIVDLKTAIQGFSMRSLIALAPQIAAMTEMITEGFIQLREKVLPTVVAKLQMAFNKMLDAIDTVSPVVFGLGLAMVQLGKIAAVIFRFIADGIIGIGNAIQDSINANSDFLKNAFNVETVGEGFVALAAIVSITLSNIMTAFVQFGNFSQSLVTSVVQSIDLFLAHSQRAFTNFFAMLINMGTGFRENLAALFNPKLSFQDTANVIKRNRKMMDHFFEHVKKENDESWDVVTDKWATSILDFQKLGKSMEDLLANMGEKMPDQVEEAVTKFKNLRNKMREQFQKLKDFKLEFNLPQIEVNPQDRKLLKQLFAPAAEFGSQEAAKILASVQPSAVKNMADLADASAPRDRAKEKLAQAMAAEAPKQTHILTQIHNELKHQQDLQLEVATF
jgi:hypothetical protein